MKYPIEWHEELDTLLENESTLNAKQIRSITDRNQFTFPEKRLMAWLFESALCSELIDARTKSELRVCRVKFERLTEKRDAWLHGDPNETDRKGFGLGEK